MLSTVKAKQQLLLPHPLQMLRLCPHFSLCLQGKSKDGEIDKVCIDMLVSNKQEHQLCSTKSAVPWNDF